MKQAAEFHGTTEPHSRCHLHPKEALVGVCPLCLNDRLLTLASLKQSHYNKHRAQQHCSSRGSSFSLTRKILALASLLSRFELHGHKSSGGSTSGSTTREDSFISIKFEDNGVAFWDKGNKSDNKATVTDINKDSSGKNQLGIQLKSHSNDRNKINKSADTDSAVKHMRPQSGAGTRRWRKRMGNIVDHVRWSSASKTNMGN
uniref:Uncharacterized protein n=1 Tax=Kalanchoe fedtschenkoi TaxID=63787 RepID=A0A7N0T316_KALFE